VISDFLTANGFFEIMNNSLTSTEYKKLDKEIIEEKNVNILNPISKDLKVLRQTLLFGGLESIRHNLNRKNTNLKFYEFGMIYRKNHSVSKDEDVLKKYSEELHLVLLLTGNMGNSSWYASEKPADFYYLKTIVHQVIEKLGLSVKDFSFKTGNSDSFSNFMKYLAGNKTVVDFGAVNNQVLSEFDIKQPVFFAKFNWETVKYLVRSVKMDYNELPKFPEVRRDLALLLPDDVKYSDIEAIAFKVEKNILKKVSLFDIFIDDKIGKGKKSYAVSFILQDKRKTLTDKEIDKVMKKLIRAYEEKLNARIR
jgi:phenylalanyl-tRNA synthetase beta chain